MGFFQRLNKLANYGLGCSTHWLRTRRGVKDKEKLYRRVRDIAGNYKRMEDGRCRVSSAAFGDRTYKPSVDRAKLRNNDPRKTQVELTDFVTRVMCNEVRLISTVPGTQGKQCRTIDVKPYPIWNHDTLPNNPAHAQILALPEIEINERRAFEKLTKALSRLANSNWELGP